MYRSPGHENEEDERKTRMMAINSIVLHRTPTTCTGIWVWDFISVALCVSRKRPVCADEGLDLRCRCL